MSAAGLGLGYLSMPLSYSPENFKKSGADSCSSRLISAGNELDFFMFETEVNLS